ncbi:S26 family signal peptidase [Sphingomonas sp. AR_OL41]|uniref:S26 family signal peptidase n=1 Tax=Sphingomonas sp. AR_OL41 TaxID=3042729 RepID=UPI002481665D|nr:S26 family signal peptidase [Sphingomonas sp. AR_OL41]MDH7973289.1 S26 family signal peptidase [Sphingomonas sp. AR_OL41]
MTRFAYFMSAYFAAMATIITAFVHPAPRLIWNASASVPIGLYALHRGASRSGSLVAIVPPAALADYLARRHYLPLGVPMLKHVAARDGQRVCRVGDTVSVDGQMVGRALARDRRGRSLPVWRGCVTLDARHIFVMNAGVRDSFDGRYFGLLPASAIVGDLTPIWTR